MKFGLNNLNKYILMLFCACCLQPGGLFAQEAGNPGGQTVQSSPAPQSLPVQVPAGMTVESLTPGQRQAVQAEMSKTGGQLTPEAVESLKKSPEFKDLRPEDVVEGKKIIPLVSEGNKELPKTKAEEPTEPTQQEKGVAKPLKRFGMDFFKPARNRIVEMETMIGEGRPFPVIQRDALSGFVGPLDMVSSYVNVTIPSDAILNPGDRVIVYYWGDMIELTTVQLKLDEGGEVSIPKVGKLVARGMTLTLFENVVRQQLQRVFGKSINLITTLDTLKSIQIFITGETFRPGSYAVSAVTTLFNALYASGGPNDSGSLREIKLLRNNKTISVDFYDYLLKGDSKYDYPLQPGDTIFISKSGKVVSIEGEVNRPGIFELKGNGRLKDLIGLANGIKPTGIVQKVQIKSVIPNKEKVLIDVDIRGGAASSNPELFDGDSVTVSPVLPEIVNTVYLEGKVMRPGVYEFKKDMRVSDLFSEINRPLGEAHLERADIVRLNKDMKTTTLIPVNIGKALAKDYAHNISLAPMDRVVIYSKWDVKFLPPRMVAVKGAVQRGGEYDRQDGMTIKDLLVKSGGALPNAYLERADLLRYDFEKEITVIKPVNLKNVLEMDGSDNLLLADRDLLKVYTIKESQFIPPHSVRITGAVQRPADYERSDGMRVKDLLVMAGGVMPNAYLDRAELLRYDFETEKYTNIEINVKKVLEDADLENIFIQDRDHLTIYTFGEKTFTPEHVVSILGSVQRPSNYVRFEGMRVKDLLDISGGALPGAYDKIEVARAWSKGKTEVIGVSLSLIGKGDENQNIQIQDGDIVTVRSESDFYENPRWIKVEGEVKNPGVYALYGKNDRISDIIDRAGGVTEFANKKGTVFMRKRENIPSDIQKTDTLRVNRILEELNLLEYDRQVARNRFLMQKEFGAKEALPQPLGSNVPIVTSGTSAAQAAAIGMAPSVAQAAGQTVAGAIDAFGPLPGIAGKARKLGDSELNQSERIIINIEGALQSKGGKDDLVLMEGDTMIVPQKEETVSVVGAVMRPTTVHFKSLKYRDYIKMSGDYTDDANIDRTLVMRVDGSILPAKEVKAVEPGDIIYVPTKVMSAEIVETADKVIGVIKYALTTIASVVVFITLLHMF